jgi:uncharacterized membrane protein
MLLMALDHTRDFFSSAMVDPIDPLRSWPTLFCHLLDYASLRHWFHRVGRHIRIPSRARRKTPAKVTTFLVTRGLWLIFLDLTVISFAWSFTFRAPYLQVIWAIGGSMIALALLQRFPTSVVAVKGAAITLSHNLLDPIRSDKLDRAAPAWTLLHQPGFLQPYGNRLH